MERSLLILFAALSISPLSRVAKADDLYLNTGWTMKNVRVIDTVRSGSDLFLRVEEKNGVHRIPLGAIMRITIAPVDAALGSPVFVDSLGHRDQARSPSVEIRKPESPVLAKPDYKVRYPNMKLLPVTFIAVALSWDFFAQASDIGDAIDANNQTAALLKITADNSSLQSQETRKTILGVTFLLAAVANTVLCFGDVEVIPASNSLTLAYHF